MALHPKTNTSSHHPQINNCIPIPHYVKQRANSRSQKLWDLFAFLSGLHLARFLIWSKITANTIQCLASLTRCWRWTERQNVSGHLIWPFRKKKKNRICSCLFSIFLKIRPVHHCNCLAIQKNRTDTMPVANIVWVIISSSLPFIILFIYFLATHTSIEPEFWAFFSEMTQVRAWALINIFLISELLWNYKSRM